MSKPKPTYNHSRGDGPFDPCPECLKLMRKKALRELVRDLMAQLERRQR